MNNTGKYATILEAIAETLERKNTQIAVLEYDKKRLEEQLEKAEAHIASLERLEGSQVEPDTAAIRPKRKCVEVRDHA